GQGLALFHQETDSAMVSGGGDLFQLLVIHYPIGFLLLGQITHGFAELAGNAVVEVGPDDVFGTLLERRHTGIHAVDLILIGAVHRGVLLLGSLKGPGVLGRFGATALPGRMLFLPAVGTGVPGRCGPLLWRVGLTRARSLGRTATVIRIGLPLPGLWRFFARARAALGFGRRVLGGMRFGCFGACFTPGVGSIVRHGQYSLRIKPPLYQCLEVTPCLNTSQPLRARRLF